MLPSVRRKSASSTPCAGLALRRSRRTSMPTRPLPRKKPVMPDIANSNLIVGNAIAVDEWTRVELPAGEEAVRKQAGKVVLFKLTGEARVTPEQIAATEIPAQGKVLVPLAVWRERKDELQSRLSQGEVGVWLATHEPVETLAECEPDLNIFPMIAVHVERFA